VVDPVALHIHERVSTQAILRVAARRDVTRDLFADPKLSYREAVKFYQHDVDWANRLILGDSLQVMTSLAQREDLAGKVQMIYVDPPYGIRFGSNFQPVLGQRDVKDGETDLTREPEMVKAYRDTWTLGVHSYLAYLRDRIVVARTLLSTSGSLFLQISDENVHLVRAVLDEVFGHENFVALITVKKTGGMATSLFPRVADYILWYARKKASLKFRPLYSVKEIGIGAGTGERYDRLQTVQGERRALRPEETFARPPSF
jgi:adenine-specific DNA-methyltransferase